MKFSAILSRQISAMKTYDLEGVLNRFSAHLENIKNVRGTALFKTLEKVYLIEKKELSLHPILKK